MALKCQLILNHSGEKPARAFHRLVDVITELRGTSALYLDAILGAQVDKDTAHVVEGEVTRMVEEGGAEAQMLKSGPELEVGGGAVGGSGAVARMFSEEEDLEEEGVEGASGLQWSERDVGVPSNGVVEEDMGEESKQSVWSDKAEDRSLDSLLEDRGEPLMDRHGYDLGEPKDSRDCESEGRMFTLRVSWNDGESSLQSHEDLVSMDESSRDGHCGGRGAPVSADYPQSEAQYEEACAKLRRFAIKETDARSPAREEEMNRLRNLENQMGKQLTIRDTSSQERALNLAEVPSTPSGTRQNFAGKLTRKRSATFSAGCKSAQKSWRVSRAGVRPSSAPASLGEHYEKDSPIKRSGSISSVLSKKSKAAALAKMANLVPSVCSRSKSFSQGDRAINRAALKAKAGWKKAILHEQLIDSQDSLLARCPRISALIMEPEVSVGQSQGTFGQPAHYSKNSPVHAQPQPPMDDHGHHRIPETNMAGGRGDAVQDVKSKPGQGLVMQLFSMGQKEMSQAYGLPGGRLDNTSHPVSDLKARESFQERRNTGFTTSSNSDSARPPDLRAEQKLNQSSMLYSLMSDQSTGSRTSHNQQGHLSPSNRPRSNTWSAQAANARMRRQHQMAWSRNPPTTTSGFTIHPDPSGGQHGEQFHPQRHGSFSHPASYKSGAVERHAGRPYARPQEEHSISAYPYAKMAGAATEHEAPVVEDVSMSPQMLPPTGPRDQRSGFQPQRDNVTLWENQADQEQSYTHRRNTLPSRPNRWRASAVRFSPFVQDSASHGGEKPGSQGSMSSHTAHAQSHPQGAAFVQHDGSYAPSDPGNSRMAAAFYTHAHGNSVNVPSKSYLSPQPHQGYPPRNDTDKRFYPNGVDVSSPSGDGGLLWASPLPPQQRSASFSHGSRSNTQSHYNQRRSTYTSSKKGPKSSAHQSQGPVYQTEDGCCRTQSSRFEPSPPQASLLSSKSSSLSSLWSLGSASSSSHASHYQQGHASYPSSPDSGVSDAPLDMSCPTRTYVPKSLAASCSSNVPVRGVETGTRDPTLTDKQPSRSYTDHGGMSQAGQAPADVAMSSHTSPYSSSFSPACQPSAPSNHVQPANKVDQKIPPAAFAPKPTYMNKLVMSPHSEHHHLAGERTQPGSHQFTRSPTSAFDLTNRPTSTTSNINNNKNNNINNAVNNSSSNSGNINMHSQSAVNSARPAMNKMNLPPHSNTPNGFYTPAAPAEQPAAQRTSPKFYISPDQEVQHLSMLSGAHVFRSAPPSPSGRIHDNPYPSKQSLNLRDQISGDRLISGFTTATKNYSGSDKPGPSVDAQRGSGLNTRRQYPMNTSGTAENLGWETSHENEAAATSLREKLRLRLNPKVSEARRRDEGAATDLDRHHGQVWAGDGPGRLQVESVDETWNPPVSRPRSQTYSGRPRGDRLSRSNIERMLLQAPASSYLMQQQQQQQHPQQDS